MNSYINFKACWHQQLCINDLLANLLPQTCQGRLPGLGKNRQHMHSQACEVSNIPESPAVARHPCQTELVGAAVLPADELLSASVFLALGTLIATQNPHPPSAAVLCACLGAYSPCAPCAPPLPAITRDDVVSTCELE